MLRTDLKIFKSQRMTQRPNAGGQRTANEVENGKLNEVFSNISAIDHAQSTVDIAKVYPGVSTASTQLLQDGHVFINEPPADPLVDIIMVESAAINDASTRADIINVIESGVTPGILLRSGLSGMMPGQDVINALDLSANAGDGEQPVVRLNAGDVIVISVEYTGAENANYPRFDHYASVVSAIAGANIVITPGVPAATPDRALSINGQTRCTKLRAITNNNSVQYHGATVLTAAVAAAAQTLSVESTTGQLLPKLTQAVIRNNNQPFVDDGTGMQRAEITLPASGVSYSVAIADAANLNNSNPPLIGIGPMFVVNYINQGRALAETYWDTSYLAGQFNFALSVMPDPDTNLRIQYYSTLLYSVWSNQDPLPADHSVLVNTMNGQVLYAGSYRTAQYRIDSAGAGVYARLTSPEGAVWVIAAYIDSETGEVINYHSGYSNLQYSAAIRNNDNAGDTLTQVVFEIIYNQIINNTFYLTAQLSAGGLVSASADENGVITGVGVTGSINNGTVSLEFDAPVIKSSISYNVAELQQITPPAELYGINQLRLVNAGAVPLFRRFGTLCIAHNNYDIAADLPTGTTLNQRPNAFIDIVDSTGKSLWHPLDAHYSYNKTTGVVTIVDASDFTGPFEVTDSISELVQVSDVTQNSIALATPLYQSYPAGSVVSSVQNLGDLQAAANVLFDMTAWNNNWSDEITGSPASANFNDLNYPVEVENRSAINERWAIVFTSATAFNCIGQGVGQIASGDTLNDFAPINPNTQQPYFVIRSEAWGGGWNAGECVRINTEAAAKPLVLLRSVSAGHSQVEQDSIRLHFRGNAD